MKKTTWIVTLLSGLAAGAASMVACSDDSPGDVDAAVCDCPAAEPPLAGRITSVRSEGAAITADNVNSATASCPEGAIVLGGACELTGTDPNVVTMFSRFGRGPQQAYQCVWSAGTGAQNNTGFAEATCLTPAP